MRRANSLTAAPKRDAFARVSAVDRTIQRDGIGRMRPASFRRRDRPAALAGLISASLTVLARRSRNNAAAIVIIACVLPSQPTTTMPGTDGSDQPGDPTSTVACRAAQSIQSSRVDMIQTSANERGEGAGVAAGCWRWLELVRIFRHVRAPSITCFSACQSPVRPHTGGVPARRPVRSCLHLGLAEDSAAVPSRGQRHFFDHALPRGAHRRLAR